MTEKPSNEQQSSRPDFIVYHVRDGRDSAHWNRAGVAWNHKDGKGINIVLDMLPVDGRLALRAYEESTEQQPA